MAVDRTANRVYETAIFMAVFVITSQTQLQRIQKQKQ